MPKTISVTLNGISGDFDEAIDENGLMVTGEVFGVTFDGTPEERTDIFTFLDTPLIVKHNALTPIGADAAYTLVNPTLDPPGLAGRQLRFGGHLFHADGREFGQAFRDVSTGSPTPEGSRETLVRVVAGNQTITLHFFLEVTTPF